MSTTGNNAVNEKKHEPAMLEGLLDLAATDTKFSGMLTHLSAQTLHLSGITQLRPWLIGALARHTPVVVVTATGREAEDLTAELRALMGDKVAWFPAWETLPHERLSPAADVAGSRAKVLAHLNDLSVVVTAARGLAQPIIETVSGREPVVLTVGEEKNFEELPKI